MIKYALVSSDNNETYLHFWEVVKKLWLKQNIKPVLIKIDNFSKDEEIIEEKDCVYINLNNNTDLNTGFLSQISRIYATKFFEDIVIISDIDMLPLNQSYYKENYDINYDLTIYSSDAYNSYRLPMCYIAGEGKKIYDIIDKFDNFSYFSKHLHSFNLKWDTDELYLSKKIKESNLKIKYLKRGWLNGIANRRIDRVNWGYNEQLVKEGYYIDCHSLRPYNMYKNEIDKLVNLLY